METGAGAENINLDSGRDETAGNRGSGAGSGSSTSGSSTSGSADEIELMQVFYALDVAPPALRSLVPPSLMQRCEAAVRRLQTSRTPDWCTSGSVFQQQVHAALPAAARSMAQTEFLVDEGLLSIDCMTPWRQGVTLAIEADGPRHFCRNYPHQLNGSTRLRNAMLSRRGFTVVSVPFYEWYFIHKAAQRALLLRKIAQAVDPWPSARESGGRQQASKGGGGSKVSPASGVKVV